MSSFGPNFSSSLSKSGIYVSDFRWLSSSCRLSPIVSKASAGALETMSLHSVADPEAYIQVCVGTNQLPFHFPQDNLHSFSLAFKSVRLS